MDSTLDTYSHVAPGLQQAAAKRFDEAFGTKYNEPENEAIEKPVSEMLAKMALPPVMLITWGQIYLKKEHAPIAQRTEHRSSEPRVVGSNPPRRVPTSLASAPEARYPANWRLGDEFTPLLGFPISAPREAKITCAPINNFFFEPVFTIPGRHNKQHASSGLWLVLSS